MTKPNKHNIRIWIKALRSGEYKQGKGQLCDYKERYCCLGVAEDVLNDTDWVFSEDNDVCEYSFNEIADALEATYLQ